MKYLILVCCAFVAHVSAVSFLRKTQFEQSFRRMQHQDPSLDLWIEQKLDNFHPTDYRTWKQRYFMQDAYSSPTGPVFLQIGGEGPASPVWMTTGHWIVMAQQVNAMCFMIEHRFYGKSQPTSDAGNENLVYLSSEQALADISYFIANATEKYNLHGRKWIVFGGSYSGALAIWARLKFPHLISGAVSASAPLHALVDFTGYLEVVKNSLATLGSPTCSDNLARASSLVASHMKTTAGRKTLTSTFRLCGPLSEDGSDDSYFQESLAGNVMDIVQYNRDNRAFEGAVTSLDIERVCQVMDDATIGDEMQRYGKLNAMVLDEHEIQCLDANYNNYISAMKVGAWSTATGARQWVYQTCSEFGWYQTTDSTYQPFVGFNLKYSVAQCQEIYGITPAHVSDAVARSNDYYGGRGVAQVVSNVTLYNGGIDPWSNVSYVKKSDMDAHASSDGKLEFEYLTNGRPVRVMNKRLSDDQSGVLSLFVPDTAHCAIMYPSSTKDSPLLKEARLLLEKTVRQWLGV